MSLVRTSPRSSQWKARVTLALVLAMAALQGCSNPQYSARRIIEEAGGEVVWEEGKVVKIHLDQADDVAKILSRLPVIDTVTTLNLAGSDITNESVERLPDWPLDTLSLRGTDITEVCLPRILRFGQLKSLVISETDIATIDGLSKLAQLETVALPPSVDDDSLEEVAKCPQLHTIYAADTQVRGPGLAHFSPDKLPNLKTLYLDRTPLVIGGLRNLPLHEGLERVTLQQTNAGDDDAEHLSNFERIDFLDFSNTQLSDRGLEHLGKLPLLYVLDLNNSNVTLEGMRALSERRPDLRMTHKLLREGDD